MPQLHSDPSRSRTLRYRGDQLVLVEHAPSAFGPGAVICFDLDGDGTFEHEIPADADGRYTAVLDVRHLTPEGHFTMMTRSGDGRQTSDVIGVHLIHEAPAYPACAIPVNRVPAEPAEGEQKPPETGICTCAPCDEGETLFGASLEGYAHSLTPTVHGVELATGKLRQSWPHTAFATRQLGFRFGHHHSSLVDYDGPWGLGMSHSFNMLLVQDDPYTGRLITADLRCFAITSEDGCAWALPDGFFAKLRLDAERCRWTMTHYSGLEVEFFQGLLHKPGYPVSICDPNGNTAYLDYDAGGLLQSITTDLGQAETFSYDPGGRLRAFTDHIGRTWQFGYDAHNRLTRIHAPVTEYADVVACQEITDRDLPTVLVKLPRTTTFSYDDARFPSHITSVTDPRGATPDARVYDPWGRVQTAFLNDRPVQYHYDADARLGLLEPTNRVTRVIDREGNVVTYEIHGAAGSGVNGRGRFGLRRKVTWTERGKGHLPLRADEPAYWEQRWLHDCDCLSPLVVVQPFSSDDAGLLIFDDDGIPANWPRTHYTYNRFRQIVADVYTDGVEVIRTEMAYQKLAFGRHGQYARKTHWRDPRTFDESPVYAGLRFEHTYAYDARGNRIRHTSPTVTRGVDAPQRIEERWDYNAFGQMTQYVDANGNVTVNTYYDGLSTGGDINTQGTFGGYLASTTVGADGSADAVTHLTTTYLVNPLGMTTREIDPKGFSYDTAYNDLQEQTRRTEPLVTLRTGQQVRYETRCLYDGAGNKVIERRSNIDLDGRIPANAWIDRAMSYDAVNNRLMERLEVDANDANDLITRFAYDGNDDLAVTRKPEGNRTFRLYDERRLIFKTFYGVAPGARGEGYPADKRAADLGSTPFIGLTIDTYDARRNAVRHRDGRGNLTVRFYDFNNRQTAEADPNGNGWTRAYDDASNVLTTERGAVDPASGQLTRVLERTYARFDEVGRGYQQVRDLDLGTDERDAVDPDDGMNSSFLTRFDPGSRIIQRLDANGNPTSYTFDAANRLLAILDALVDQHAYTYDANSNVVRLEETEVPGPGAGGDVELYVTTFVYDELNRKTEHHIRGRNATIDHTWRMAYDSRNNERLVQDAEHNVTLVTYDDADRKTMEQRFDGDPGTGWPRELLHAEWTYDRNSRVTEERTLADVDDPTSAQRTRHAFDDLDRCIRTVYPDADDPVDGRGAGADGLGDQVELRYDANSNLIGTTDQRGVRFANRYDPGNRIVDQHIDRPASVPGVTRQTYAYDALDRMMSARNDFARIDQHYDPLSRLTSETQQIRLDGSGFVRGWEQPIRLLNAYDRQSNRLTHRVRDGRSTDLNVGTAYDALNRPQQITALYFHTRRHPIATYAYHGPMRVRAKALGNGAVLTRTYDPKRRVLSHRWTGPDGLLVGFAYAYDRMDNVLFERFAHDEGRYDHFTYNDRYEVVGVAYRVAEATPPAYMPTRFFYDDVFNRTQAVFGDPLGSQAETVDSYTANQANEYLQVRRNGQTALQAYDPAGNPTRLLVRPAAPRPTRPDVLATARWDAYNLLFDIDTGVTPAQHYRYDALRRRIATFERSDGVLQPGSRRYIYDGWEVVEERVFGDGATLAEAPSALERIYVNGAAIDEPLLTAIDGNGDHQIGGCTPKNIPGVAADHEYYFLDNRLGSIMALLDADDADRLLEQYRYTVFGEATVLPLFGGGGDGHDDGLPDATLPVVLDAGPQPLAPSA